MANENVTVTFNGRHASSVFISYVTYTQGDQNSGCIKELDYLDTERIKEVAKEESKSSQYWQFTTIEFRTTDRWVIEECKNKSGAVTYTQMIPISSINTIEVFSNGLRPVYVRKNELLDTEAEQMK
jgi:hypothetical protein